MADFNCEQVELIMAQMIELNDLLNFQQQQSASYIADFLTTSGGWITDHTDFQNDKSDYEWFKADEGEQFEPHTKTEYHITNHYRVINRPSSTSPYRSRILPV